MSATDPADPTVTPAPQVILVVPDELADLKKITGGYFAEESVTSANAIKRVVEQPTAVVGAAYGDAEGVRTTIMFSAVSGTVRDPAAALAGIFDRRGELTDIRSVEPGPLGGVARCGKLAWAWHVMCGWADSGSVGIISFQKVRDDDAVRRQFPVLREQVRQVAGNG